ncbi:hypothetical protein FACS189485_09760 [Spirochaetia bacterium]|nr:hypothetical protein FACS189485_09760 [Spirochaetia bacterium]
MKILTVSIAAYNVEDYIAQCLDSFADVRLNETLEVLVVNDGSTDGTAQIAEQYVQKYPAIFRLINKENGGHGSTINRAIKEAAGKYYKPVDGDDWVDTENLIKIIDKLKEIDVDLVITDYCEYFQKTKQTKRISVNIDNKNTVQPFDANNDILVFHQIMYKTSVLKNNNIHVSEKCFFEDTEFSLYPVPFVETMMYFPIVLYYYRLERDGQSVSVDSFLNHRKDCQKVLINSFKFYEKNKNIQKVKRLYFKNRIYGALDFYNRTLRSKDVMIYKNIFFLYLCFLSPYLFLLFFLRKKRPLVYKIYCAIKNEATSIKYKPYSIDSLQKTNRSLLSECGNVHKILIISPVQTHPTIEGNRTIILLYSNLLKSLGYSVYFLWISQYRSFNHAEYIQTRDYWGDKFLFYPKTVINTIFDKIYGEFCGKTGYTKLDIKYPVGLKSFLGKIQDLNKFDTVIINYVIFSKIFKYFKHAKKILFTHDALTNKYQRTGLKWYSLKVKDEARGLNRADVVLSVQETETIFFKFISQKKILTTYAYFPINSAPSAGMSKNVYEILFLSGNNPHNQEGFVFFYREVFSELKTLYPQIKLTIGGSITTSDRIKNMIADDANIENQGIISDLHQFYMQSDICINPTFNGTGIKMKTFEALSYGKILLAHPHSVIGVYDSQNVPIILAASKNEYLEQFRILFSPNFDRITFKNNVNNYMIRFQNHVKQQFFDAINS